jgi:hypothetical protein
MELRHDPNFGYRLCCVPFLFPPVHFDDNVSIFFEHRDLKIVRSLRAAALEIMEKGDGSIICDCIHGLRDKPYLLAEFLHPGNITLFLYFFFFGEFETCQNLRSQKEMFGTSLFDYSLHKKCDPSSQLSMVKHWHQTLIPFAQSLGFALPSFNDILAILSVSQDSPRYVRTEFLKIGMGFHLSRHYVQNILSNYLNGNDPDETLNVLKLIPEMAANGQLNPTKSGLVKHQSQKVCHCFHHQNLSILQLLPFKLCFQLLMLEFYLFHKGSVPLSEDLFDGLMDVLYSDLWPLKIWTAFVCHVDEYYQSLTPAPDYCCHFPGQYGLSLWLFENQSLIKQ